MKVEVLGSGCPKCKALYEKIEKLRKEGRISCDLKYIADVGELVRRGIMGSPALAVNGKVVFVGMPSDSDLLKMLKAKG